MNRIKRMFMGKPYDDTEKKEDDIKPTITYKTVKGGGLSHYELDCETKWYVDKLEEINKRLKDIQSQLQPYPEIRL